MAASPRYGLVVECDDVVVVVPGVPGMGAAITGAGVWLVVVSSVVVVTVGGSAQAASALTPKIVKTHKARAANLADMMAFP